MANGASGWYKDSRCTFNLIPSDISNTTAFEEEWVGGAATDSYIGPDLGLSNSV
jgi:hypothetical protein